MIRLTTECRHIATTTACHILLAGFACLSSDTVFSQSNRQIDGELTSPQHGSPTAPPDPESAEPGDNPAEHDVLMRGPVHEAFAAAPEPDATPGQPIDRQPPARIEEVPPDYRPDGNDVQWIPGYWAWDDSHDDFVWVSGIWREKPPGRRWVPGYWEATEAGHVWVSGYWAPSEMEQPAYLPPPPKHVETSPSTPAPGENFFYVPGHWRYDIGRYRWIAGYWRPIVTNWIWIPAEYVWTPNGCVYIPGYLDYEITARGVCFAPVYFHRWPSKIFIRRYTPQFVIHVHDHWLTHLFLRRHCRHYYFGDWYGDRFAQIGFRAWVTIHQHHHHYDPLFAYYKCRRSAIDPRFNVVAWAGRQHHRYLNHQALRPATTYADHIKTVKKSPGRASGSARYISSYRSFAQDVPSIGPGATRRPPGSGTERDINRRDQSRNAWNRTTGATRFQQNRSQPSSGFSDTAAARDKTRPSTRYAFQKKGRAADQREIEAALRAARNRQRQSKNKTTRPSVGADRSRSSRPGSAGTVAMPGSQRTNRAVSPSRVDTVLRNGPADLNRPRFDDRDTAGQQTPRSRSRSSVRGNPAVPARGPTRSRSNDRQVMPPQKRNESANRSARPRPSVAKSTSVTRQRSRRSKPGDHPASTQGPRPSIAARNGPPRQTISRRKVDIRQGQRSPRSSKPAVQTGRNTTRSVPRTSPSLNSGSRRRTPAAGNVTGPTRSNLRPPRSSSRSQREKRSGSKPGPKKP